MGQNIEKIIREKLENRTIAPSNEAWDRLDAMLSVNEKKEQKRTFVWWYVAAAVLVGLGFIFWNTNDVKLEIQPENTVVNAFEKQPVLEYEKESTEKPELERNPVLAQQTKTKIKQEKPMEQVEEHTVEMSTPPTVEPQIKTDIAQLLAEVEIQKDYPLEKIKVDAGKLLSEVETELRMEYRESVFERLKRNINHTAVVVANRNYEK